MKLAHFIKTSMDQLLKDWEEAALEIAPELKGKDTGTVRDHAREILEFISQDLITAQSEKESARKALGKGKVRTSGVGGEHGSDRLRQGLSMLQLVQELRALRARITRSWREKQAGLSEQDIDDLVRFNEAVDQLIIGSISSFSTLKEQETRLIETLLNVSVDPAAIFAPDGKFLFSNTAMAELTNTPPRDVNGKTPRELSLNFTVEFHDAIAKVVSTGRPQSRELDHCLPSVNESSFECHFVPVFDKQDKVEAVVMTARDITERKRSEHQIWHSANYDDLTGIPNRRLFLDRLEQTLREAQRKDNAFALLFVDLDRFKQANDQLGHEAGDRLLVQVADRLNTSVRAMDTVARLGGDEFTMILKETDRDSALQTAKALLTSLEVAFDLDSNRVHLSCSIGITVFPDDGKDVVGLMHNADQAMYAAKQAGGHQVKLYEPWMTQLESEHMRLNRELDEALRNNQLEVYYQPIVDTRSGSIARAEALLRWYHPDRGLLTPDAFLSVSDRNGMADRITTYVLEQASSCSCDWRDPSGKAFPISINESPSFFSTRSILDRWRARRSNVQLDGSWITLELTPASFNNIRALGFNSVSGLGSSGQRLKLAVDGFGIELLSLLALQETELDGVKLDRELIKGAGRGGDIDRVLEGLIAMAHAINVQVVGVGVENDEQLRFLTETGCDYAQGFLFSKPLRQDEFEALLKQNRQKIPPKNQWV